LSDKELITQDYTVIIIGLCGYYSLVPTKTLYTGKLYGMNCPMSTSQNTGKSGGI